MEAKLEGWMYEIEKCWNSINNEMKTSFIEYNIFGNLYFVRLGVKTDVTFGLSKITQKYTFSSSWL